MKVMLIIAIVSIILTVIAASNFLTCLVLIAILLIKNKNATRRIKKAEERRLLELEFNKEEYERYLSAMRIRNEKIIEPRGEYKWPF